MTGITGLDDSEAARIATQFAVAIDQVHRDHLISAVLGALDGAQDLIFFGGTALARTHLITARLSEDIDLIATGTRRSTAERVMSSVGRALLATHGPVTWQPPLDQVREVQPSLLRTDAGITLRVQLLSSAGYEPWPTEVRDLHQRYKDSPRARLRVPTLPSFAAWKTAAWVDRAAPRDLFDLWALAEIGALSADAAALFARHGPTSKPPQDWMFATPPTQRRWRSELAGQTRLLVGPEEALRVVRLAWSEAVRGR